MVHLQNDIVAAAEIELKRRRLERKQQDSIIIVVHFDETEDEAFKRHFKANPGQDPDSDNIVFWVVKKVKHKKTVK